MYNLQIEAEDSETIAMSFSDPDSGDTVTPSFLLDDGSAVPSFVVYISSSNSLQIDPAASDVGTYSIVVTLTDDDSGGSGQVETIS
jgi:hypothetical protein